MQGKQLCHFYIFSEDPILEGLFFLQGSIQVSPLSPNPSFIGFYFTEYFSFQNSPKNLDPSYKTGRNLWDCLRRVKLITKLHRTDLVTLKILKFGTPQTIAIIVLKIENFDVTLH